MFFFERIKSFPYLGMFRQGLSDSFAVMSAEVVDKQTAAACARNI